MKNDVFAASGKLSACLFKSESKADESARAAQLCPTNKRAWAKKGAWSTATRHENLANYFCLCHSSIHTNCASLLLLLLRFPKEKGKKEGKGREEGEVEGAS